MYEAQIAILVLSVTLSFLLALMIQRTKKPALELRISEYSYHNQNRMKIAHIRVRNQPVRYISWFMNRDFATNCRAHIVVKDATTEEHVKAFDELKWALNPEPLKYDVRDNKLMVMVDPAIVMTAGLKNLGERWEDLDIALKHEGDDEFYMNTTRNYPLNLKPEQTRIGIRRCFLDVTMSYDNGTAPTQRFYLRNDSSRIMDFELSESPFR
jgi:hypothetical protein